MGYVITATIFITFMFGGMWVCHTFDIKPDEWLFRLFE